MRDTRCIRDRARVAAADGLPQARRGRVPWVSQIETDSASNIEGPCAERSERDRGLVRIHRIDLRRDEGAEVTTTDDVLDVVLASPFDAEDGIQCSRWLWNTIRIHLVNRYRVRSDVRVTRMQDEHEAPVWSGCA